MHLYKFHIDHYFTDEPIYYGDTQLIQLGRLYCTPSAIIDKHAHGNVYELTVVTEGEGTIITNNVPTKVEKGNIYLSFPGDFHEIRSSEEKPLKYDFFAFNTKNEILKKEFKTIVSTAKDYGERVFNDEQVNSTVSSAIAELSSKQEYHSAILSSLFEQILYYTIRNFRTDKIKLQSKHTVSTEELCYQIMHYIDTHIYTMENLSVLSQKLRYNYSYLSDVFKKTTGNTIVSYYQSRRLDAASLLLIEGKLRVNQIAEMLKYSSLYSFSKAFKSKYGVSPKNYANSKKEEK